MADLTIQRKYHLSVTLDELQIIAQSLEIQKDLADDHYDEAEFKGEVTPEMTIHRDTLRKLYFLVSEIAYDEKQRERGYDGIATCI
jgi:hypothetical protein